MLCRLTRMIWFAAFNWKQKKLLKISNRPEEVKVKPFGDWTELEQFFDPSRGDVMIPWDEQKKSSDDPRLLNAMKIESDKKRINMRLLFGSNKIAGFIPRKEVPKELKKYNYERIFGEKHRKRAAEKAAATATAKQ